MSYQEREYNEINGSRPCIYRDPLQIEKKHHPATNCCKANDQIISAKFFCKKFNKNLECNTTLCWLCKERKETND